jgi:ankyrin repeat protein
VAQHLVEAGVDLNTPASRYGGTALHGAICCNHISIVRALLEAGADAGQSDSYKVNPLHTAAVGGYIDCARLLLQYGADRNALGKAGEKPIDWAMNGE